MSIEGSLSFDRGDDATITVTIAGSGSISGQEFRFDVWRTEADAIDTTLAVLSKTMGVGSVAILSATGRTVLITLNDEDTESLDDSTFYFKFRRTLPTKATLAKGVLELD
jgi:hypothetical protein